MAGSNNKLNGSLPNRSERETHAETAPGTVTLSHPWKGIWSFPSKYSGDHAVGERPEAFKPCNDFPSHRIQNASEPNPLPVGSSTVRAIAVASAASTAFPPLDSIERPACAASGCDVETTFFAKTGERRDG